MSVARWIGLGVGAALLVSGASSIIYTLVLPRAHPSRLSDFSIRSFHGAVRWLADRTSSYESKDKTMALAGPAALLGLFGVWGLTFLLGYTLVLWPLVPGGFDQALKSAGSALFTLGLAGRPSGTATGVSYLAAATGLVAVALEIAYLPTIYAAFNRRETLVTLLQSRAGAPAWGPEILARHELVGITGSLPGLYRDWEIWAADVAETHTTYPVLVVFRSPNALRSWVVGLLAVLDSAALQLALSPGQAPSEARLCLRMGFVALREIVSTFGFQPDSDPMPDAPLELSYEDYMEGVRRLEETGVRLERSPEDAWPHFRGWRVNYESSAYFLADLTAAVPGPWSGPRHRLPPVAIQRPVDRTPEDPEGKRDRRETQIWPDANPDQ